MNITDPVQLFDSLKQVCQVWDLIVSIPDLCTLTYFLHIHVYATTKCYTFLERIR